MITRLARPKALLCDLDGTLLDTLPGLHATLNAVLAAMARPAVLPHQVRDWIGDGVTTLLHRTLTRSRHGQALSADLTVARGLFDHHYHALRSTGCRAYPGVLPWLDQCTAAGLRLACVTNKPAAHARALLADLGLGAGFAAVVGGDSTAHLKPHPAPLRAALAQLGCAAGEAMMVGDSAADIRAARALGMPVVTVRYGYGRPDATQPADAQLQSLLELPALWREWPSNCASTARVGNTTLECGT